MPESWVREIEGCNKKYFRETLLNYAANRWGLNKASSVGPTSELIRNCSPREFEQWKEYYFNNAKQKKKNGIEITPEYLNDLGGRLYTKLSEVVSCELAQITEKECIDYIYNLVLNRTYEGYMSEVDTIYGQLQDMLGIQISPAPDEWDRRYNIDFYIEVGDKFIGLQIKPITGRSLNDYQWEQMHENNHRRFIDEFGGKVFFVYSVKGTGKKKKIDNPEIIDEIIAEIERLRIENP
ncbi:MAG: MjaI family restriction endonuclease [Sedimentisphaeraceae bacterium JB056]